MKSNTKNTSGTKTTSGQLPEALRHDETVNEYIEAEAHAPKGGDKLPEPPEDHVEVLADGEKYIVHDPARDSFELDHNAPLETPMARELDAARATEIVAREGLMTMREGLSDEAMRPEEETQTAAEMVQDEWIDEQEMLDMAQIDDVLDPVETE